MFTQVLATEDHLSQLALLEEQEKPAPDLLALQPLRSQHLLELLICQVSRRLELASFFFSESSFWGCHRLL